MSAINRNLLHGAISGGVAASFLFIFAVSSGIANIPIKKKPLDSKARKVWGLLLGVPFHDDGSHQLEAGGENYGKSNWSKMAQKSATKASYKKSPWKQKADKSSKIATYKSSALKQTVGNKKATAFKPPTAKIAIKSSKEGVSKKHGIKGKVSKWVFINQFLIMPILTFTVFYFSSGYALAQSMNDCKSKDCACNKKRADGKCEVRDKLVWEFGAPIVALASLVVSIIFSGLRYIPGKKIGFYIGMNVLWFVVTFLTVLISTAAVAGVIEKRCYTDCSGDVGKKCGDCSDDKK